MGRNTWDSLGRPLPGRRNLVISRNPDLAADGTTVCGSLRAALEECPDAATAYIIGGAQIYQQALGLAEEIIPTEVHTHIDGDAFFPAMPADHGNATERLAQPPEKEPDFDLVV